MIVDLGKGDSSAVPPLSAPARTDTEPGARDEGEVPAPPASAKEARRGRARKVLGALLLVVVVAGLVLGGRYLVTSSWYVGLDDSGMVTIYRGIPDEIAGMSFKTVEEVTDIRADNLPEAFRDDVEEGHRVDSRQDAEQYVANLRSRIEEIQNATERRDRSPGQQREES